MVCGQGYTAISAGSGEFALWLCLTQSIVFNFNVAYCELMFLYCCKVYVFMYN